jgi:hypothetical protein
LLQQTTLNDLPVCHILDDDCAWHLLQDARVCQAPIPRCPINDSSTPQYPQDFLVCQCVSVKCK